MIRLEVITEIADGIFWGRIESGKTNWLANGYGETIEVMKSNLREVIKDYVANEGRKDKLYASLNLDEVDFTITYDLESFFEQHKELTVAGVAQKANMDPGLLRHYIKKRKNPSDTQLNRIQRAIHDIGIGLSGARIV